MMVSGSDPYSDCDRDHEGQGDYRFHTSILLEDALLDRDPELILDKRPSVIGQFRLPTPRLV
jgi:hypothetical protein